MIRTPSSIRLSDEEKSLLQAAAARRGVPWSKLLRQIGVRGAVEILEHELPDLRPTENVTPGDVERDRERQTA